MPRGTDFVFSLCSPVKCGGKGANFAATVANKRLSTAIGRLLIPALKGGNSDADATRPAYPSCVSSRMGVWKCAWDGNPGPLYGRSY